MTLIDAYILRRFAVSYLGCLLSLLLLYMVLDVFTKLDDFTTEPGPCKPAKARTLANRAEPQHSPAASGGQEAGKPGKQRVGLRTFLVNLATFYGYRLPVIFDLINGLIVLMAATFTLGWLEKQNELLPLLAAGVRMRRILLPAWLMTALFIGLGVANRELLIPLFADQITRKAEDPNGTKPMLIQGGFDKNGVHLDGKTAYADRLLIMQGRITFPAEAGGGIDHISCQEMYYRPAGTNLAAGWWLNGCRPDRLERSRTNLEFVRPGCYFLTSDLSFDRLTRRPNWFLYLSTPELAELVEQEDQCPRRTEVITTLHCRFTAPLTDYLIVLLGLPLLVGNPQRSIYIKVGGILGLFALAQAFELVSAGLARSDLIDPSLAAWLPLMVFGPWAVVASDGS